MFLRRILEPILLGFVSNLVVNFIFSPGSYRIRLDELITAIVLSVPITELNRFIDQRLEKRFSWIEYPLRRFATHLLLLSVWLLISLNVLGNAYLWITQNGYFTWKEAAIINLVTLCFALLLTVVNWSIHFYFRWKNAEAKTTATVQLIDDLRQKIAQGSQLMELQKGNTKIKVETKNIRIATIEFGTVRVYSDKGEFGIFAGTLREVQAQLPEHLFFQVSRDSILHREVIQRVSSSTFGKIQLTIRDGFYNSSSFTVSRPKAAAFRKWYNNISA